MAAARHIDIPPMSAVAFTVAAGNDLRIEDSAGGQPGDLVAFNLHDPEETFSQARTRVEERACRVAAGDRLWTSALPPRVMFTVLDETAGAHDLLYLPCCRYALESRFGVSRDGCHERLVRALAPWGIPAARLPAPLNLFFTVWIEPSGRIGIGEQTSRPGDGITLRAEMDCLVAVAACSAPRPDGENTGYRLTISGPPPVARTG